MLTSPLSDESIMTLTKARQDALLHAYRMNDAAERAPFMGVRFDSPIEIAWIFAYLDWKGQRIDLSGADLHGLLLREVQWNKATLEGINLSGTDLRDADLSFATLTRANLAGAICNLHQRQPQPCKPAWGALDPGCLAPYPILPGGLH
jgi:hypothetical protein